MVISENKTVTINYTLKNDSGKVLDSSSKEGFSYIHGKGHLISGLEKELEGKKPGDKFHTEIDPKDGYGEYKDSYVFSVSKEKFDDIGQLKIGSRFRAQTNEGEKIITVKHIEKERVTIDMNHPLAGQTLFFDIEVMDVRDSNKNEPEK
ncbi:MAG: peptidylprolyl isomerase [Spirochaetales bacterium]|nr:peptidylprolyl isomerase [Spirochaetales bacterium]